MSGLKTLKIYAGIKENKAMRKMYQKAIFHMAQHQARPYIPRAYVKRYMDDDEDTVTFIVLDSKKNLCGVAIAETWINKPRYQNQFYVALLMTHPQNKGIGTYLLKQIEKYATSKTAAEFVSIRATLSSEPWYVKQGYHYGYSNKICERQVIRKRQEISPGDEFENEVPMKMKAIITRKPFLFGIFQFFDNVWFNDEDGRLIEAPNESKLTMHEYPAEQPSIVFKLGSEIVLNVFTSDTLVIRAYGPNPCSYFNPYLKLKQESKSKYNVWYKSNKSAVFDRTDIMFITKGILAVVDHYRKQYFKTEL